MLSSNDWQQKHDQFLSTTQALLYKSEECLAHLELISDDEDAIGCLVTSLRKLAQEAQAASVSCIADFSRQVCQSLETGSHPHPLSHEALLTVKNCLTLISWQVELLDPNTGELKMDNEEQLELLEKLASTSRSPVSSTNTARQ
ncbi:Uncharacterized protein ABJ99_3386 [Pseudomonas syringae pv. cilantro]|uniref:CheA signal transduction histidine kinase n=2 Tax=Pseudomonas syringae group TaxID=136849 RepID=A0A0N0GED9_PSESX|nr:MULTISPECIES: hypothetical protein [Pseudomonas syringae group]KPC28229.1 Uncharacterized protein ABJ99_3386 [Pseudomonas syringae pv. cilantro]KPW77651.1 Uncharacterized protein ALO76_01616 [Pseudomonas syringae pv. coriandricola]RMN14022.1 hypothetical protein ALQ65_00346 [Pseudomonas syringae pv. coriandricola]